MTRGTEFQEATEASKPSEEIKESPEKVAEFKEVVEETKKIDDATLKPKEVVEAGDIKAVEAAETLESAFVAAVPVQAVEVTDEGKEPLEGEPEPVSDLGDPGDGSAPAGESSDAPDAGSRASRETPEVSTVQEGVKVAAVPEVSLTGSKEAGSITIGTPVAEVQSNVEDPGEGPSPDVVRESSETGKPDSDLGSPAGSPSLEQTKAEQVPDISAGATAESQSVPDLETVERDDGEPKLVMHKEGEEDSGPDMDDGYEQAGDLKEPNQVSSQFGSAGDPTKGSVGYVGDPAQEAGEIPEIPDMIPDLGIDGAGPPDIDIPDLGLPGLDQESELAGLADSAAFGADGRISAGAWTGRTEMTDSTDSKGKQDISYNESYEDDDHSMTVTTTHSDGVTTQTVTSTNKETGETTTETSTTGGEEGDATPPATDQEEYDPEGDYQYTNAETDHTLGGRIKDPIPVSSPEDDLDDESVMQPVDEDSASPKEPGIVFDRATQTDPYRQDTDEYVDLPKVTPEVEENYLIDPPDFAGGGGDGVFINTETGARKADDDDGYSGGGDEGPSSGEQPKPSTGPDEMP